MNLTAGIGRAPRARLSNGERQPPRRVENICGDVEVVRDVSLDIIDGEFLVLVGPSGSGKSTVLRLIAGLERPSKGDVLIGDRVVTSLRPKSRDVAMVFQNYALYPHMTVAQNLAFSLETHKVAKTEVRKRVQEIATVLGLDALLKRKPAELSGGQRQRVAMGRAMVRDPQVLLLDEPLSNLDAALRVEMRTELKRIHYTIGTTAVYVTHDQVEAMTLGDRVAVLRAGVLEQLDTPLGLYRRPANVFVAGFIGSPAMNLVEATVRSGTVSFGGYALRCHPESISPGTTIVGSSSGSAPQNWRTPPSSPIPPYPPSRRPSMSSRSSALRSTWSAGSLDRAEPMST